MDWSRLSRSIDQLLERLFPIQRSLTGGGNRLSMKILQEIIPIKLLEYPAGTKVYDWVIPSEWNIEEAWIKDANGSKLIDFKECNLHVVGYSEPINKTLKFSQLSKHLHRLNENSNAIPYRTTYYEKNWGFCVTGEQYRRIEKANGPLKVFIDSTTDAQGSLTVGELVLPGKSKDEYFVSTYFCHPSMANDNLSGLILTAFLAQIMVNRDVQLCKSWRFIFVPETIGAICYLKHNEASMKAMKGGFVASCCGGPGRLGYKETFMGDHLVDRAIRLVFRDSGIDPIRYRFSPDGSDERQYSSPGFRIPTATISKDKYYEYSEYHTSLDNLDFVNGSQIVEALKLYLGAVEILDKNKTYRSTMQYGEPQLGRRDLYPSIGGGYKVHAGSSNQIEEFQDEVSIISWILFLADGSCDLVTMAERSKISFELIERLSDKLFRHDLLEIM